MRFLGVNANGLKPRLITFKKVLSELKPSVFFVEESKFKDEGQLKIENYVIFEQTRETRDGGGGLALGCVKELNPVLVRKGDEVEAMSVDIFVRSMTIRCCVGYGCQETSLVDKKTAFWNFIEEEVISAWNSGSGFILHFDGNLWAGPDIIPGDPRRQNNNGRLFQDFLTRNPNLSVVNALPLCEGLITRKRTKNGSEEKSVLDFFVVCSRVLPYITKMVIDEDRKHILTNYKQVRRGGKATDSDHFTQYMDLNLHFVSEKPERKEIFNFKDKKSQVIFKNITSNTNLFSKCFENNLPLEKQVENWRQVLQSHCQMAFKKIRITKKKRLKALNPKIVNLISQRNELKRNSDGYENERKVEEIEEAISNLEAEESREFIMKTFQKFSEDPESLNLTEMWKVLKKVGPKSKNTLPIAKLNHRGKLVSNPKEIKKLLAKEYKQRLRSRPTRPDLGDIKNRRKEIFRMQLKLAEETTSAPWDMKALDKALANLKNNKARDHAGYINELFKSEMIGSDLKRSLLYMLNELKIRKLIPIFMKYSNITTVPKRGSLTKLENERGIFRVDLIRSILMRLIYNDKYPEIDKNMSDSQMGGRKGKGCRNNIFIINGIIHDVLHSKNMKPVLLQIYDYAQMFDSIDLQQAISDVYEAGLKDDNLSLVYKANKEIFMAVNTPSGLSERQTLENIVLQGDTWGSLLASVQVDSIGQECSQSRYGYLYKNVLPVGILGLVDDTIGITEAGYKAHMMNGFINTKTAEKSLQFGVKKCKTMLVGEDLGNILNHSLSVDKWSVEHREVKTTGDTELVETFIGQVEIGKCTEQRYLGFIISNSGNNMANIQAIKNKSIGTIRQIFTKLNSLNLRKYYFECGMLFMNVMLRSSILYASETYYNLKEYEIRQLERIEENFMRQLLKTTKGCPISQLYSELGQIPARFDILKLKMFYLKDILNQDPTSMIYNVFYLQIEKPVRFDWASSCIKDLKRLNINMSFDEIRNMPINTYKSLVRKKCKEIAFEYLMKKRGSKGSEIRYSAIQMADYLLPNNQLTIEEQRKVFSIRNKMVKIASNFTSRKNNTYKCICEQKEDMLHIYTCRYLNSENAEVNYEYIYHGNVEQQKSVLRRFENNLDKRMEYSNIKSENEESDHAIHSSDPLFSELLRVW